MPRDTVIDKAHYSAVYGISLEVRCAPCKSRAPYPATGILKEHDIVHPISDFANGPAASA
jgi:hypothetical protein